VNVGAPSPAELLRIGAEQTMSTYELPIVHRVAAHLRLSAHILGLKNVALHATRI
jgi:hypothetical protein